MGKKTKGVGLAALPHLAYNIKCVCFLAFEAQLKQCNM